MLADGIRFVFEKLFTLDVMPFLVVLFPLFGFVALAVFGDLLKRDREERGAGWLACAMVLLSFACALWTAFHIDDGAESLVRLRPATAPAVTGGLVTYTPYQPALLQRGGDLDARGIDWISVGSVSIPFSLLLDRLTVVMILVVTGIGSLIHIYSLGYMAHDPERVRYFSYLNLFTFFMLLLVMGGSLPVLFVGWEGVGLCSYLLIGFWFKKQSASDAGKKAFIVNRIGDAGLILGMIVAFHSFGSLNLFELLQAATGLAQEGLALASWGPITAVCLLLFVGACGKSAQVPLHVWLPDAMEGPTPVSALIHAATMVTAGVYLVARLGPLYALAPAALLVVSIVGIATALMAATIALVQTDIKKVLAYSTVSQLGYMFLACGVGAFGVAVFHLFTHAFFKALLFLGSGSVIHAMGGEQDMRKMGGLRKHIPWTFWTFLVGTLAIAGIPPLAGYYSKDEILGAVHHEHHLVLFAIGLLTAALTAFYMSRLLFMTFFGGFRGDHETEHHLHESPATMVVPLVLLAAGSAVVGWLVPIPKLIATVVRVRPAEHHPFWLVALATSAAVAGIATAFWLYVRRTELPARIAETYRPLYRLFDAKWGFDDAFNWVAARVVVEGSTGVLWKAVDTGIIDRIVNGFGTVTELVSRAVRQLQTGFVRGYALVMFGGAVAVLSYLLWLR